jgi:hypothetical protein
LIIILGAREVKKIKLIDAHSSSKEYRDKYNKIRSERYGNVSISKETHEELHEAREILIKLNELLPFTSKKITQHSTISYALSFFIEEYEEVIKRKGINSLLVKK